MTFLLPLTALIQNVSVSDVMPLLIGLPSKRLLVNLLVSFDEFFFCVDRRITSRPLLEG
jgi:hypothetical protein